MVSVVEICVDYGGVYVFHVCFDLCVVYGAGICADACGVVCVVVCCLFLASGCSLLCCDVAILSAVFCVICSLLLFVSNVSGDHKVKTYSSMVIRWICILQASFPFVFPMLLM